MSDRIKTFYKRRYTTPTRARAFWEGVGSVLDIGAVSILRVRRSRKEDIPGFEEDWLNLHQDWESPGVQDLIIRCIGEGEQLREMEQHDS